jgi:hypothetical protein
MARTKKQLRETKAKKTKKGGLHTYYTCTNNDKPQMCYDSTGTIVELSNRKIISPDTVKDNLNLI